MFVLTYLLCAIALSIIVGRMGTIFKAFIVQNQQHKYPKQLRKQIAK